MVYGFAVVWCSFLGFRLVVGEAVIGSVGVGVVCVAFGFEDLFFYGFVGWVLGGHEGRRWVIDIGLEVVVVVVVVDVVDFVGYVVVVFIYVIILVWVGGLSDFDVL